MRLKLVLDIFLKVLLSAITLDYLDNNISLSGFNRIIIIGASIIWVSYSVIDHIKELRDDLKYMKEKKNE